MTRDIITKVDSQSEGGLILEGKREGDGKTSAPPAPKEDRWYEQLVKYIPGEALSLYLALDGVIRSAQMTPSELRFWLGISLVVSMAFTWVYLSKVWQIRRTVQIGISTVALVAYVFALGGVFATFDFYKSWQGTVVLVISTAFLAMFPPPGPATATR